MLASIAGRMARLYETLENIVMSHSEAPLRQAADRGESKSKSENREGSRFMRPRQQYRARPARLSHHHPVRVSPLQLAAPFKRRRGRVLLSRIVS